MAYGASSWRACWRHVLRRRALAQALGAAGGGLRGGSAPHASFVHATVLVALLAPCHVLTPGH